MPDRQTKLRFWGGLQTIGGNIASIEYGTDRVIFDFGLVYQPATNIFDQHVQPRAQALVPDFLKLGLIPPIEGIYAKEELKVAGLALSSAAESSLQTAVLISHLHLDHMGAIGLLDPSIPVYMTDQSVELFHALETTGETILGACRPVPCTYNETLQIGEIQVTPLRVDHDCYGAAGFHIETPDMKLVYSGDLRLHGQHPQWIEQFIAEARRLGVDVLLMEGTTLRQQEPLLSKERELNEGSATFSSAAESGTPELALVSEQQMPAYLGKLLENRDALAIFNVYHRNLDRLVHLIDAAQQTERQIVFEPETAYLLMTLTAQQEFTVYASKNTLHEMSERILPQWKQRALEYFPVVTSEQVQACPHTFLLQNSYHHLLDLLDVPLRDALYIHAGGLPLGAFDPAYDNLIRFLERFKVVHHPLHLSGHAHPQHLTYIATEIDPALLIPWHSFYPQGLQAGSVPIWLPEYGQTYVWTEGKQFVPITDSVKCG